MENTGTRWTSHTIYVDGDTGERINKDQVKKQYYLVIKTVKHATLNFLKTKGHIEYTIICRRNPQTRIFT